MNKKQKTTLIIAFVAVLAVIVALPLLGRKREDSFHNNYDD